LNLSELKVIAFGLHIEKTIKFTKGLNVIVGESEEGKSTLVRALYLLIENSPRAGEKLYQSWLTDKKMVIQLKDDLGNTVKRKNNKYYINDGEPLKAFGTSVPDPVRELFNFKEINWQKQLDRHYLLFSTGGGAAKLLNSATGMSDQETIINEFKQKLSNSKSEIKRHKKNNDVHLQTIERLKNITRYRIKAEAIIYLEKEVIEIENKSNKLENILVQLELIKEVKVKYKAASIHNSSIEKIVNDLKEIKEFNDYTSELKLILTKIKNTEIIDPNIILKHINSLHAVHSKKSELDPLNEKTKLLNKILIQIKSSQAIQKETKKAILIQEKEINDTFKKLGYCPLCRRRIEDGDTCCRG